MKNKLINYLAHAYLSFHQPEILVGNMISDYVKGKKKFDYPYGIQQGIMLHRAIDNFTDNHEATRNAKEVFRPVYRLYSGAVMDVLYDHFLASDTAEFTEADLFSFSQEVYDTLGKYSDQLPEYFAGIFPSMKQHNWLLNYRNKQGTQRSLGGLVKRAAYLTESGTAFSLFEKHYDFLKECYHNLWADIKPFARQQLEIMQNEPGIWKRLFCNYTLYMKKIFALFLALQFVFISLIAQTSALPPVDNSPMDMSYFPNNYPVLKIQDKISESPSARIIYSRPQKISRAIFGGLVKYGEVWRMGANEATEIEFFKNVNIGGKKISKGRYSLYALVNETSWTMILNKDTDTWGAFRYDAKKDVLRTEVPVQKTDTLVESLAMVFEKTTPGCNLVIAWENTKVSLPITF